MDEYVNILWYDENPTDQTKDILSTIYYRVFLCSNVGALQKTINDDINDTEKILLILSGAMNYEVILSTVHSERRIVSIFILTTSLHIALEVVNEICGIFTDYEALEKKMLAQARMLNHQAVAFDFDEKLSERSMEELIENPEMVLFDLHSRFSPNRFTIAGEKEKLLKYCRRRYDSNSTQLKLIDEFERTYAATDALRWYSKDCFLFSSLNKCMRKRAGNVYDCDMVYFAVDLSMQIQLEWQKQRTEGNAILNPFHVYRGSSLPEKEITRIQNYRGRSITTKGFLSTTTSLTVARIFAANVVFDIQIDPKLENIVYANISTYSYIPHEEEILIDYGTSFRVVDIVLDPVDNCWTVQLVSVNEIYKVVDSYIDIKRLQKEDDIMIATSLVFFGHKERACRLLRESINNTNDNMQKLELNCELGEIYAQSGEFMLAADSLREAHRLCILFDPYSLCLHSVAFLLPIMYACLNEHDRAFDHLAIHLEFPDPNPYSIPRLCYRSYSNLVTNEESLRFDSYRIAYEHLQQCLILYKKHDDVCCKIHFYLGLFLLKCSREENTLQSLDDPLLHFKASGRLASYKSADFLILYYYYMGVIYESKERYHEAIRYYRRILPILRCNCDQSQNLVIIYVRIAACYTAKKKYTLAIQRYIRALQQSLMSDDLILNGKVRAHLGITYLQANEYNEAIEQFIGITSLLDVVQGKFVYEIYLIIAETLLKVNDVFNAMTYYSKFLNRNEEVEKCDCELWFDTCERMIYIYLSDDQCDRSIICAKKMLDFRTIKCPDSFDDIINAQLIVGLCYQRSKEWQEAINYFKMAYNTLGKKASNISTGEYTPLISDQAVFIQSMLANFYRTIHDYEQAICHANITLETEEKRLSRDKITIASCYDFIGWCYYLKSEYDKALDFCTRGLHLLQTCASESDVRCCSMYHSLGAVWLELGDSKQSFMYCVKAIHILSGKSDFENQKGILAYFFSLLERIRKLEDNTPKTFTSPEKSSGTPEAYQNLHRTSCTDPVEVLQSESFSDMSNSPTISVTGCSSSKDIREQSYFLSEDILRIFLSAVSFKVYDDLDAGSSLHTIHLQESQPPSPLLYPMLAMAPSNKSSSD